MLEQQGPRPCRAFHGMQEKEMRCEKKGLTASHVLAHYEVARQPQPLFGTRRSRWSENVPVTEVALGTHRVVRLARAQTDPTQQAGVATQ